MQNAKLDGAMLRLFFVYFHPFSSITKYIP